MAKGRTLLWQQAMSYLVMAFLCILPAWSCGKKVVTNDGVHGMEEVKGDTALEAGWHPIELIYFQGEGGQGLEVRYEGAGIQKMIIPSDLLGY